MLGRREWTMKRIRHLGLGLPLVAWAATAPAQADEIDFWHSFTQPERIAAMEEIAADFEASTGTKVTIEVVPWSKVREKWTAAAAAGTMPDVSICTPENCVGMHEAGLSRDMTDLVESMGGTDVFASDDLLNSFHRFDDNLISLPFYTHVRLLIYRKDVFDELGLEPPSTWEEYVEAAKALTDPPNRYGMVQMWDASSNGATQWLFILTRSNSGSLVDADGNSNLNSPEVIEAVNHLVEMYKLGSPDDVSIPFHGQTFDLMTSGKSMMTFETMFMADAIRKKRPDLYERDAIGYAPPPMKKELGLFAGVIGITALKGDNEEASDAWIRHLYKDENYISFLHTIPGGMYPATKSVATSPAFFDEPHIQRVRTGVDLTLDLMPQGRAIGATHGLNSSAPLLASGGIVERMMQDIVLNGTAVEAAVETAHKEFQRLIDRNRRS